MTTNPYRSSNLSSGAKTFARSAVISLVVLVGACVVGSASCTRVDPGHVGIRVKLAGSSRGVQNAPIVTGWVAYNPLTELVVEFPTSVQNIVWTRDAHEGSPSDESISFASSEGVSINADIGLAFHIDADKAPRLYARFRQRDVLVLAHGYIRNVVREALNETASTMPVQEIYGAGKTRLLNESLRKVTDRLGGDGFVIDQLTFNSALRLPDNVVAAINRAMEATQNAIQSENQVRQIRAEAEQRVTAARGEAEAARQRASGEADALLIRARAEAQANEIIRLSMTPAVIQYRALQRWDGQLPTVNSGQIPMLTMDTAQIVNLPEAERRARLQELLRATPANAAAANAASNAAGGTTNNTNNTNGTANTAAQPAQPQMVPTP